MTMTTRKEFEEFAEKCRSILIKEGFTELADRVITYSVRTNATKSLGTTTRKFVSQYINMRTGEVKRNTFIYNIEMNWTFVLHSSETEVHNTIMHEMCHCVDGGMKHTGGWKRAANSVRKYGFDITRLADADKIQEYMNIYNTQNPIKYRVVCPNCGVIASRKRDSKMLKEIRLLGAKSGSYCAKCGSRNLTVEE